MNDFQLIIAILLVLVVIHLFHLLSVYQLIGENKALIKFSDLLIKTRIGPQSVNTPDPVKKAIKQVMDNGPFGVVDVLSKEEETKRKNGVKGAEDAMREVLSKDPYLNAPKPNR